MTPQDQWPALPSIAANDPQAEVKKILFQGQVDLYKAYQTALEERTTAAMANEYALRQAVQAAYLDAAKGQLDRTQTRAQFVQTAATAIGTAYVAVLGLTFTVGNTANRPLPTRGIISTIFLGLAITLATTYLAYLTPPHSVTGIASDGTLDGEQMARRSTYIKWIDATVGRRSYWLRAAVASMGCGVACLPLPYLMIQDTVAWVVLVIGVLATFAVPTLLKALE